MNEQVKLDTFMKKGVEATESRGEFQGPYDLPQGWKWVKLGDVSTRKMGGTPRRNVPRYWGGDIVWATAKTIIEDQMYVVDSEYRITQEGLKNSNAKLVPKGSVLLVTTGATAGKVAIAGVNIAINQQITAIIPNKEVDNFFLFYALKFRKNELLMLGGTTTFKHINQKELARLLIPLPPLEEQKRIVSRLEQLISRAEEAKRLRKLARGEAEKIMQAALNKVFSKAEEEGWKKVGLGEVTSLQKGRKPSKLSEKKIEGGIPYLTAQFMRGLEEPKYCLDDDIILVKENDVLIIMDGSYSGDVFIGFKGALASTMAKFLFDSSIMLPGYLYYFLKNNFEILNTKTKGATIPHVRKDVLFNLKIPLPPVEEQKNIVTYLDRIKESVRRLMTFQQQTEEELEKLVPSILDQAFRGEL